MENLLPHNFLLPFEHSLSYQRSEKTDKTNCGTRMRPSGHSKVINYVLIFETFSPSSPSTLLGPISCNSTTFASVRPAAISEKVVILPCKSLYVYCTMVHNCEEL